MVWKNKVEIDYLGVIWKIITTYEGIQPEHDTIMLGRVLPSGTHQIIGVKLFKLVENIV